MMAFLRDGRTRFFLLVDMAGMGTMMPTSWDGSRADQPRSRCVALALGSGGVLRLPYRIHYPHAGEY
jgi:hypothetical protein